MMQDRFQRAGIDGRFAFALAILFSGIGLLALMNRIGVPDGLVRALAVIFILIGLAAIAALLRSMRVSWFYAAGRVVPTPYAGLAMASLGAGLFLPFVPPVPEGTTFTELFAGFACGMALASLLTGPLLRKTGAFSIPDLVAARFPHLAARLGAILLTAAVTGLVALAGYQQAISSLAGFGLGQPLSAALVGCLLVFIVLPGGLAGALWTAAAAAVITLTVFGLPLLVASLEGQPLALPVFGSSEHWALALIRIETWTGAAQAKNHMNPISITAIALGLGTLAPLLSVSIACENRRAAQRAGFAALCWGGIFILLAAVTLAQSSLALDQAAIGKAPDALPQSLYDASADDALSICGTAVADRLAARRACASRPGLTSGSRLEDITVKGSFLLTGFAEFGGFGSAFSGLASAALSVLGVALAAFGIQSCATVLGNDLFYRVRDHAALTSRRLAVTRLCAIGLIGLSGTGLALFSLNPQLLIAIAILLSASALAPLLLLTLWPRATSFDATVTLLAGLFTAEALIAVHAGSGLDRFAASAVMACIIGLCAGLATSLARRQTNTDGSTFTKAMISERGEWLHPDKGA